MRLTAADWVSILPALTLMVAAVAAVGVELFRPRAADRGGARMVSCFGLAGAFAVLVARLLRPEALDGFGRAVLLDGLALLLSLVVLVATALMVMLSTEYARRRGIDTAEYYALILMAAAGMLLLVQSLDLITFFIALEILSLSVYVLSGILRRDARSNEAAVKYFVTGAFATGFVLYGVALLYGATGSLSLEGIGRALAGAETKAPSLATVGMALLAGGLAFKVGAVPFHMWVPDVYQGAPTPVTAFMSVTVKAAAFGAFIRVLLTAGWPLAAAWGGLLAGAALATMVVGNLLALWQRNVKRMLAYSSVAHTGYVLVGLAAMAEPRAEGARQAGAGAVFYLFSYTFMTLGAFAFLVYAGRGESEAEDLDDFAGLAKRRPWTAAMMTLFMVSLAGLPPTAGFFGKFLVFSSAVAAKEYVLVVAGMVTTAISVAYYLRVVVYMYMMPGTAGGEDKPAPGAAAAVALCALVTIALGLQPGAIVDASVRSLQAFLR